MADESRPVVATMDGVRPATDEEIEAAKNLVDAAKKDSKRKKKEERKKKLKSFGWGKLILVLVCILIPLVIINIALTTKAGQSLAPTIGYIAFVLALIFGAVKLYKYGSAKIDARRTKKEEEKAARAAEARRKAAAKKKAKKATDNPAEKSSDEALTKMV